MVFDNDVSIYIVLIDDIINNNL